LIIVEVKAKKVIKLLRDNGFKEVSVNGDHHKFANAEGIVTVVPYSQKGDTIYPGTLNAILKQTGLKNK
jgi:predicted RNA binding protein YcfA (HicA-like mRNA interferase family)